MTNKFTPNYEQGRTNSTLGAGNILLKTTRKKCTSQN